MVISDATSWTVSVDLPRQGNIPAVESELLESLQLQLIFQVVVACQLVDNKQTFIVQLTNESSTAS